MHKEAQYYAIGPLLEQLENMQPLKGEKVRQAFLGLMPYYKGEGQLPYTPGDRVCKASFNSQAFPKSGWVQNSSRLGENVPLFQ